MNASTRISQSRRQFIRTSSVLLALPWLETFAAAGETAARGFGQLIDLLASASIPLKFSHAPSTVSRARQRRSLHSSRSHGEHSTRDQ